MLDSNEQKQLAGLISSAMRRHVVKPTPLERMTMWELIRSWSVHLLIAAVMIGSAIWQAALVTRQVRDNTAVVETVRTLPAHVHNLENKMREIRPLVRQHEWQVHQGLTNKDLKQMDLKPPEFPEEDYSLLDERVK